MRLSSKDEQSSKRGKELRQSDDKSSRNPSRPSGGRPRAPDTAERGPLATGRPAFIAVPTFDVTDDEAERLWQGKRVSRDLPDGAGLCLLGERPVAWVTMSAGVMKVQRGFPAPRD